VGGGRRRADRVSERRQNGRNVGRKRRLVVSGHVFGIVIFIIVESHPLWATAQPRQGHAKQVKARALEHAQHDGAAAAGRRRYVKAFAQRDE